ncbi:MAG: Maf-like protein [Porticoccaceae bacterium]|nr:MAG: Maf-like protein [Porticoccaceae bacterium]
MSGPRLVLASASPRRAALLRQLGVSFRVHPVAVDEAPLEGEAPAACALRLARAKAVAAGSAAPGLPVLGADTVVAVDGQILGKPDSAEAAADMLRRLAGRWHRVWTAVALLAGDRLDSRLSSTAVLFADLDEATIARYLATGEGLDKAGGYAVQGYAAAFVRALCGSYSGVVGLPLAETAELLATCGVPIWSGA